ncbi:hypothetical protein [Kribbella hippodromi]
MEWSRYGGDVVPVVMWRRAMVVVVQWLCGGVVAVRRMRCRR